MTSKERQRVFAHRLHRQHIQEKLDSVDETCCGISRRIHRHSSDVPQLVSDGLINVVPALQGTIVPGHSKTATRDIKGGTLKYRKSFTPRRGLGITPERIR